MADNLASSTETSPALASTSSDSFKSEDEMPDWLVQYNADMSAASKIFPISQEELDAMHVKYYDTAYEQMMLSSSAATSGNSPKRPVHERIRSKKARVALAAAKQKFIDMNEAAGAASFLALLGGNGHNPLSESDATAFIDLLLKKVNRETDSTQQVKLAAMALSQRINKLSVSGEGADSARLKAAKEEADAALDAQIAANRLLGSRVEELERENSELHRILDDNTNKALDSWSTGQIKIAKLEEEVKTLKNEKNASDKAAEEAKTKAKDAEEKFAQLKDKMEAFVADESKAGDGSFMETAFACIPGIAAFTPVKE